MIQSQDKTNSHPLTNKTETLIKLNWNYTFNPLIIPYNG